LKIYCFYINNRIITFIYFKLIFSILGGLFNPEDELQEVAFRYAVDRINMDRVLLPKTTLVPIIERVATHDSFHTAKRGNKCCSYYILRKNIIHCNMLLNILI
jgi:hypothetical protein